MFIPKLEIAERCSEYNKYSEEVRDLMLFCYLFEGESYRSIDSKCLGLSPNVSKGFQSMSVLHHLGITKTFKGCFEGKEKQEVINELNDLNDLNYIPIIQSLQRLSSNNHLDIEELKTIVTEYKEGGKQTLYYIAKYERNKTLRDKAILIHGTKCKACGIDFEEKYGELGKGFIEVHHIKPLHTLTEEINVDPKTDMVCLCSNCHRMIHRNRAELVTVEKLVELLHQDKK